MNIVYLISNSANGKRYVGKTEKTSDVRLSEHLRESKYGSSRRLYQAIRKHGAQCFSISILETCLPEDADTLEKEWITKLRTREYQHGYNMTNGGEGKPGALITKETREKIGRKSKSRISAMTDAERRAMTRAANNKKKGAKERPSGKSDAQIRRWAATSLEKRAEHGAKSLAGVSEIGRVNQIKGMNNAFSPVRQKGFKQPVITCPHCNKSGGRSIMGRYHFERCKVK